MFFLLIGTRGFERLVAVMRSRCPNCGVDAPQRYFERGTGLTLFLIPVLPLSRHFRPRARELRLGHQRRGRRGRRGTVTLERGSGRREPALTTRR
jgi:hypothetical protein